MNKQLSWERFHKGHLELLKEFYALNKYLITEQLKDALLDAIECMEYTMAEEGEREEAIEARNRRTEKHGYWSECYTDEHHYSGICSVCGGGAIRKVKAKPLDYCPKCGARMDLKDGDTE